MLVKSSTRALLNVRIVSVLILIPSVILSALPYILHNGNVPVGWDTAAYLSKIKAFQTDGKLDPPGSTYLYVILASIANQILNVNNYDVEKILPVLLSSVIPPMSFILSYKIFKKYAIALPCGVFAIFWFGKFRMFRDLHDNLLGLVIYLACMILLITYLDNKKRASSSAGGLASAFHKKEAILIVLCVWLIGVAHFFSYFLLALTFLGLLTVNRQYAKELTSFFLIGSLLLFAHIIGSGYANAFAADIMTRFSQHIILQSDNFVSPDLVDAVDINTDNSMSNVIAFSDSVSVQLMPIGWIDVLQFAFVIVGAGILLVSFWKRHFARSALGLLLSWLFAIILLTGISLGTNLFDLYRVLLVVPVPFLVSLSLYYIFKFWVNDFSSLTKTANQNREEVTAATQYTFHVIPKEFFNKSVLSKKIVPISITVILIYVLLSSYAQRAIAYQANSPFWINENLVKKLRDIANYRNEAHATGTPVIIVGDFPDSPTKTIFGGVTVEHTYFTMQSILGPDTQLYLGKLSYFESGCVTPDANDGKFRYSSFYFNSLTKAKMPFDAYMIDLLNSRIVQPSGKDDLDAISSGIYRVNRPPTTLCDPSAARSNNFDNENFEFWDTYGNIVGWNVSGVVERVTAPTFSGNSSVLLYPGSALETSIDYFPTDISLEAFVKGNQTAAASISVYDGTRLVAYHLTDNGNPIREDGPLYKVTGKFIANKDRWNRIGGNPDLDWKAQYNLEPPQKAFLVIENKSKDPVIIDDMRITKR